VARVRGTSLAWVALFALAILAGCASDRRLQSSNAGKSTAYSPGSPDFDFEAMETVRDGQSGVDLWCRIPRSSLVFVRDTAGFVARYELRAKFVPEADSASVLERSWDESVRSGHPVERRSTEELLFMRRVAVAEGRYIAEVVLEDLYSGITSVRRQGVTVFSANDLCARILRIALVRDLQGTTEPFLPLHIPAGRDSLRAVVTLRFPGNAVGDGLHLLLLRYPADSLPASPPFYITPTAWALRRTQVDFRKADTVMHRSVPFTDEMQQTVSIPLANLRPGYYEIIAYCSARACGETEGDQMQERSRGLVIVDPDFPRVVTRRGLAEPLLYLATEKEYNEILEAGNDEEMRRRFERFWLHLGGTPDRAASLIREYYTRVEEANLEYSAYKEGWKTDRGMVYVVFGAPTLLERGFRQQVWSYSAGYVFLFELVNPTRFDEPVENWALVRDASYEIAWKKEIDRWRRGQPY
jgi:GWxTD domain-containing protein